MLILLYIQKLHKKTNVKKDYFDKSNTKITIKYKTSLYTYLLY